MSKRFPSTVVLITAAAWFGFAVWLGLFPSALLHAFAITEATPQMLTEIRAFYGGVEFAIGAAMIILWRRHQVFAALLVGGLPLIGAATGRLLGMAVDGFSSTHAGFAVLEIVGAGCCFAGCVVLGRFDRNENTVE
ncbi:MAG: DUF4345 family protein [Planctomycetota bacterium]